MWMIWLFGLLLFAGPENTSEVSLLAPIASLRILSRRVIRSAVSTPPSIPSTNSIARTR